MYLNVKSLWIKKETKEVVRAERKNADYVSINEGEKFILIDSFLELYKEMRLDGKM